MNRKRKRIDAIAAWFLEVSALVMVFPVVDQLFRENHRFNWITASAAIFFGLIMFMVGLVLTGGE